jgi:PKD repeat protein
MDYSGGILYETSGIYLTDNFVNTDTGKTFTDSVLVSGSLVLYSDNYASTSTGKTFTDSVLVSGEVVYFSNLYINDVILDYKTFTPGEMISVTARSGLMTDTAALIVLGFYSDFIAYPRSVLTDEPIQFTSSVFGADNASWTWDFGDGIISHQENPVHSYSTGGNYSPSLTVTSINGESAYSKKDYYITVTELSAGKMKLYPVATNQRVTPYKAGTDDQIQIKFQLFGDNRTRLSYLNDVPLKLKLNYNGWQSYETSATDNTGSQVIYHPCTNISGVSSCLGYVVATIDGKIYKSNITRFNFI